MKSYHAGVLILTALLLSRLHAETPLDRVRKDAGLCIVVDDLPSHVTELRESPLGTRLQALRIFQQWQGGRDYVQLQRTLDDLKQQLGQPVPDALLNLAGDQLVLAIYPASGQPPAGVLMTSPANLLQAKSTIDLWNRLERAKVTKHPDGYWVRETDKATLYYLLTDKRFALSDRESLIREIATVPAIPPEESIKDAPGWDRADQRFDDRSWIRVWFRPELWAGVLDLPEEKPGLAMLLAQLKRAESVILEIDTQTGMNASLRLLYKADREPDFLRRYRRRFPAVSGILDQPSPETLFFLVGRGGFDPLAGWLAGGWPDPNAKEPRYFRTVLRGLLQGRDPYEEVLPRLGSSWSMDVRRSAPEADWPLSLLVQIALDREDQPHDADSSEGSPASLASAVKNLLDTGLRLLRDAEMESPGDPNRIERKSDAGITVYRSPSGWEPSYYVDDRRLLVSSSESRVRAALDEQPAPREQAHNSPFQALAERKFAATHLGLLINFGALRTELTTRPEAYLRLFRVPENKRSDKLAALSHSADALQLFDAGYLLWRSSEAEWSLHVGTIVSAR